MDETHATATYGRFVYIAGETSSYGAGKQDSLLLKVDSDGEDTTPTPVNTPNYTGVIAGMTLLLVLPRKCRGCQLQ